MDSLKVDESLPIELKTLTKTIANAQKKVEGMHYGTRKNVLKYDDVMNQQRELIYQQRDQVLDEVDLKESILGMLDDTIDIAVDNSCASDEGWDLWEIAGLREKFLGWITEPEDLHEKMDKEEIREFLKTPKTA